MKDAIAQYLRYIEDHFFLDNSIKSEILRFLNSESYDDRLNIWLNLSDRISNEDAEIVANPFFLGYGNPKANTIIFGIRNAIDLNPPVSHSVTYKRLFFEENLNNLHHWKDIVTNQMKEDSACPYPYYCPISSEIYEPIKANINGRHTWGIYSKLLSSILKGSTEDWNQHLNNCNSKESIFQNFFLSEINHIPAKSKNDRGELKPLRQIFLQNEFFKSFENVIIGAKTYFKQNERVSVESIFNASLKAKGFFDPQKKRLEYQIFENSTQKIFLIPNLSGAAGWTNQAIIDLSRMLK